MALSSVNMTRTGYTTATVSVSTTDTSGTLYRYISTNSTESVATVKASGTTSSVSASGVQGPFSVTGQTPGTTYYVHFVYNDGSTDSAVSSLATGFVAGAGAIDDGEFINGGAVTSLNKTTAQALASGTSVLVWAWQHGGTAASTATCTVTDSLGTTYTKVISETSGGDNTTGNPRICAFVGTLTVAGTPTVTMTWSAAGAATGMLLQKVVGGSSVVDFASSYQLPNTNAQSAVTGPSPTLAAAGEFASAFFITFQSAYTQTIGSGWTLGVCPNTYAFEQSMYQTTPSTTAITSGWPSSAGNFFGVSGTVILRGTANAPIITTNVPATTTVLAPATATFSVTATASAGTLTYQWQRAPSGSSTFTNISGANSSSYTTAATTLTGGTANNGDQYRVVLTDSNGTTTSTASTLTVNQVPTITTQPSNVGVTAPSTSTFSVVATGNPAVTYQWERQPSGGGGFSSIALATSASYTTPATSVTGGSANNGDQYRVVITNSQGTATSNVATLTVNASGPTITGPSGSAGAATSTFNLNENATTGPLFSTDIAVGVGYPTITGTDASLFTVTNVGTNQWRVNPSSAFNFEALPHTNPFVFTFNASASTSQACTVTVINVPEMTGSSGVSSGVGTVSVSTTVDTADGTWYAVISAAQPTIAQIKAGQDSTGVSAGTRAGNQVITSTGLKTMTLSGVSTGTNTVWMVHTSAAGVDSVVTSYSFNQATAISVTGSPSSQSGTLSSTFSWTGANPISLVSGGVAPITVTGSGLVGSGLTVNPSTGVLSGTCATNGTYNVTLTFTDSSTAGTTIPQTATTSFTLVISNSAVAPSVTTQPSNQTVAIGQAGTFTVSATGSGTLTYQWQRAPSGTSTFSNIAGANASSYTTSPSTLSGGTANNGDQFRVIVTGNTAPAATSNAVTLTVTTPVAVTTQGFVDWFDPTNVMVGIVVPKIAILTLSLQVLEVFTNRVTDANGVTLWLSNGALVSGQRYLVVATNADGSLFGMDVCTAA